MSLLYEHYVLGLLRETYGKDNVIYQREFKGIGKPDFLFKPEKLILDTKYKPQYDERGVYKDDIWQLAGYARSIKLMEVLGITEEEEQNKTILPCVIIYPQEEKEENKSKEVIKDFKKVNSLIDENIVQKEKGIVKFYKLCVALPIK